MKKTQYGGQLMRDLPWWIKLILDTHWGDTLLILPLQLSPDAGQVCQVCQHPSLSESPRLVYKLLRNSSPRHFTLYMLQGRLIFADVICHVSICIHCQQVGTTATIKYSLFYTAFVSVIV